LSMLRARMHPVYECHMRLMTSPFLYRGLEVPRTRRLESLRYVAWTFLSAVQATFQSPEGRTGSPLHAVPRPNTRAARTECRALPQRNHTGGATACQGKATVRLFRTVRGHHCPRPIQDESGGLRVDTVTDWGLESPQNPQAGKPALSWAWTFLSAGSGDFPVARSGTRAVPCTPSPANTRAARTECRALPQRNHTGGATACPRQSTVRLFSYSSRSSLPASNSRRIGRAAG